MQRLIFAALLATMSCGGTSSDLSASDVAIYRARASDLGASVAAYCSATASMNSAAACTTALSQYSATARPDLDAMGSMGDRMDSQMHRMGSGDGDLACDMGLGSVELTHHLGVACSSADLATNRAEAQRHCGVMQPYTDHLQMRGVELSTVMSGGMSGGMMNGSSPDGGWTMADGGTMSWGHRLSGCGLDGGTP